MHKILFEDTSRFDLLPLSFTRPVFELRAGIYTNKDRWKQVMGEEIYSYASGYLQEAFNHLPQTTAPATWINGKFIPTESLRAIVQDIAPNSYVKNERHEILCAQFPISSLPANHTGILDEALLVDMGLTEQSVHTACIALRNPYDFFLLNQQLIAFDFELAVRSQKAGKIEDPHTRIYGADNLFVGEGVKAKAAIINAEDGPIYLGPGSTLHEGAIIRRSHAIGAYTQISMGAKLRGDSSFGPYCKVGGEVGNSVIMGYSSKAHEGYLGNSVLGFWCNIGADSNSSNLKNNYANVRIWNYRQERFLDTGLQFCGLIMGDHSKCAINSMFNTGTVVGVFANIFGSGFPRNFIPSFSWGGAQGFSTYQPRKAFEVAKKVMMRRNIDFSEADKRILEQIFADTASFRRWEVEKVK